MPRNATTVLLPFSTTVMISAVTNASFEQIVILQPEDGSPTTWTGTGEDDNPIGSMTIQTPSSGTNPNGYQVTVTVYTVVNGQKKPSSVVQGSCGVMNFAEQVVVSEDNVDEDWNDAVVFFVWWKPPSVRELQNAATPS